MSTNNLNRGKIDFGYDAQFLQVGHYTNHVKLVTNILTKPSDMCKQANDHKYYETMKRNRTIANLNWP